MAGTSPRIPKTKIPKNRPLHAGGSFELCCPHRHFVGRGAMRFALVLLFVAAAVASAVAQGTSQKTPPGTQATPQATAKGAPSTPEEVLRQRILLRERFNKGWDIQAETSQERERRCRTEAKKHYSAIHPFKRRKFTKD